MRIAKSDILVFSVVSIFLLTVLIFTIPLRYQAEVIALVPADNTRNSILMGAQEQFEYTVLNHQLSCGIDSIETKMTSIDWQKGFIQHFLHDKSGLDIAISEMEYSGFFKLISIAKDRQASTLTIRVNTANPHSSAVIAGLAVEYFNDQEKKRQLAVIQNFQHRTKTDISKLVLPTDTELCLRTLVPASVSEKGVLLQYLAKVLVALLLSALMTFVYVRTQRKSV